MIQLKEIDPSGKTKMFNAKPEATLQEIVDIMEKEVTSGYAVYAAVLVDGKVYVEMEV